MFEEPEEIEASFLAKLGGNAVELPDEGEAPPADTPSEPKIAVSNAPIDAGAEPRITCKQFTHLRMREEHRGGFVAHCRAVNIETTRQTADQWDAQLKAYWKRPIR